MDSTAVLSSVSHDFGGFSVSRLRVVKAGPVPPPPVSQLRIVASFDTSWETAVSGGRTYEHDRGEICILPPRPQRQTRIREPGRGLMISVTQHALERLAAEPGTATPWGGFGFERLNDPVVNRLMAMLDGEFEPGGPSSLIFAESVVMTLLGYLLRSMPVVRNTVRERGGLTPVQLQRCQDYIRSNIADSITIADLAATAGLSQFYFIRAFKRTTGATPHRSVLEARVRTAQGMLQSSARSVAEIAGAVGFLSTAHFDAAFKKIVGMTPTSYRRLSAENPVA